MSEKTKQMRKAKKEKTDKLKKENPNKEICWGCNRIKEDCICWRPTDYDPKYCKEIIDYFEKCQAEIMVDVRFFQPNKNSTISTILNPLNEEETLETGNVKEIAQKLVMNRFPTFIRFARSIWVTHTTLYERKSKYEEFSYSMNECIKIQEAILLENWLQWTYNSAFAQFLLKNNHWYTEKTEVHNTHKIELDPEDEAKVDELMEMND